MMNIRRTKSRFPQRMRERGAVLLVALVFLVLLTLLALGASSSSLLQQRMVSATRSAQLATMSANTALRGAEWKVWNITKNVGGHLSCGLGSIDASTGCIRYDPDATAYSATGDVTKFRTPNNTWLSLVGPITYKGTYTSGAGAVDYTGQAGNFVTANVAENPQYIIEDLGRVKPPSAGPQHESGDTGPMNGGPGHLNLHIFRITARATGGNKHTVRVVQSTFDAQATN